MSSLLTLAGEKRLGKDQSPPPVPVAPAIALLDVAVASIPSGARVEVERMPVGRTAAVIKLQPGEYRFRLTLDGYDTWERKVVVRSGAANAITAELQRKTVPAVSLRSSESEAREAKSPPVPAPVVRSDGGVASSQAPTASDNDPALLPSAQRQRADKELHVGPRGGVYHYSKSGKKVYEKRK
jgi:hypothetical protein